MLAYYRQVIFVHPWRRVQHVGTSNAQKIIQINSDTLGKDLPGKIRSQDFQLQAVFPIIIVQIILFQFTVSSCYNINKKYINLVFLWLSLKLILFYLEIKNIVARFLVPDFWK